VEAINIKAEYVTPAVLEEMKKRNLKIYVWNCHDEVTLRKFFNLKVDAVFSNYPDIAVKIRNEIQ
jgi:glycerophosphoryl diester phosphodiesterase